MEPATQRDRHSPTPREDRKPRSEGVDRTYHHANRAAVLLEGETLPLGPLRTCTRPQVPRTHITRRISRCRRASAAPRPGRCTTTLEGTVDYGRVGIWSGQFRGKDEGASREAASELDELGFGTLWIPGAAGGDILDVVERSLAATTRLTLATGILNVCLAGHRRRLGQQPRLAITRPALDEQDGTAAVPRVGQPLADHGELPVASSQRGSCHHRTCKLPDTATLSRSYGQFGRR
jgi:hypothetical protein